MCTQDSTSQSVRIDAQQAEEEIQQLRDDLARLTSQLDETKQAWQEHQQKQMDLLRNQFEDCLTIDYDRSFDEIVQQVVDQLMKERQDFNEKCEQLEKQNDDLRSGDNFTYSRTTLLRFLSFSISCARLVSRIEK